MDNKDHNVTPTDDPHEFWDARYASASSVWSGQVNAALAAVVEPLDPGSALDLGSGEGGDVCWLAQRGWFATGVELSAVAVERARKLAEAAGCQDRARFIADDLTTWRPPSGQRYDLITASFLQSPVRLERASILWEISRYLTPGGRMVILAHAKPPAWLAGTGPGLRRSLHPTKISPRLSSTRIVGSWSAPTPSSAKRPVPRASPACGKIPSLLFALRSW
ncbi:class I SAM-dependent methyltransferase [Corynebacterium sanguinis]|uniref:SAM-dependent methyltransferase n=2 Tax=Corynebacterium sanguinis TaxID=2594913 RepID=UPI00223BB551|nr:class I SAM-dependent methyltransferase [Corynebacterium sanguinis]MCT1425524.1 class I SAM-dependent methyltransferase [Corynebacterium sanguinis]